MRPTCPRHSERRQSGLASSGRLGTCQPSDDSASDRPLRHRTGKSLSPLSRSLPRLRVGPILSALWVLHQMVISAAPLVLFRSEKEVQELTDNFLNQRRTPNLRSVADVHVLVGCIKKFLAYLKEPLIPRTSWTEFAQAARTSRQQLSRVFLDFSYAILIKSTALR